MFSHDLFRHLQQGLLLVLHQGLAVGMNNTPFPIFMRTRLIHPKRPSVPRNSIISPHGEYAISPCIRIAPLHVHRYKLLYKKLDSQRWYFHPLGHSILQCTQPPALQYIVQNVAPLPSPIVVGDKRGRPSHPYGTEPFPDLEQGWSFITHCIVRYPLSNGVNHPRYKQKNLTAKMLLHHLRQ